MFVLHVYGCYLPHRLRSYVTYSHVYVHTRYDTVTYFDYPHLPLPRTPRTATYVVTLHRAILDTPTPRYTPTLRYVRWVDTLVLLFVYVPTLPRYLIYVHSRSGPFTIRYHTPDPPPSHAYHYVLPHAAPALLFHCSGTVLNLFLPHSRLFILIHLFDLTV